MVKIELTGPPGKHPCPSCRGKGYHYRNRTWNHDPQFDESEECRVCEESGWVSDDMDD